MGQALKTLEFELADDLTEASLIGSTGPCKIENLAAGPALPTESHRLLQVPGQGDATEMAEGSRKVLYGEETEVAQGTEISVEHILLTKDTPLRKE